MRAAPTERVLRSTKRTRPLRLKLELVPVPLWGMNLRAKEGLRKGRWDTFRRKLRRADQAKCAICEGTEPLHGHEVWEYADRPRISIAKLIRVELVCQKCHFVNHWGRTRQLVARGTINQAGHLALRKHFRTVNACRQSDFERHIEKSVALWYVRNSKKWWVDWGDFAPMIKEAEAARDAWVKKNPTHNDPDLTGPGHHMPDDCPSCRAPDALEELEDDTSEMSEGQYADYMAGTWGTARCRACGHIVDWEL